jgi:hypothetical protein
MAKLAEYVEMAQQRMDQGSRKWSINFDMSKMQVWDFDQWVKPL